MDKLGPDSRFLSLLVIILFRTAASTESNSTESAQSSARWVISEFSACSAECGGGIQVRVVRCMLTHIEGVNSSDTEARDPVCSQPTPSATQPCNNHACSAHWTKGDWSECSETCGTGTQTREVTCESSVWHRQRYQVSSSECSQPKPETSRKCHVADCSEGGKSDTSYILSENYTLIQIERAKKITVNVGGQVNLLPRQTVVVRCPVKRFSKKLLYWSRGYRLVPFMGRVRSTNVGLRIDQATPSTDAGVYKCIAGDQTASVTIQFIDKDDPRIKIYKKWIQKSKQQQQQSQSSGSESSGPQSNDVLNKANNSVDELNQQGDQSVNSTHSLMYVTGDWSSCSATCRSSGQQTRNVSCASVTPKYLKVVPDSECGQVGLRRPDAVKECLRESCAVWRPGPWSRCRQSCGRAGSQRRIVACVSEATGRPAFGVCDIREKPPASKPCNTRPCQSECTDYSRYCSLASLLKLCKFHYFREQCCHTCRNHARSQSYS